jgi:hypothetical protein
MPVKQCQDFLQVTPHPPFPVGRNRYRPPGDADMVPILYIYC